MGKVVQPPGGVQHGLGEVGAQGSRVSTKPARSQELAPPGELALGELAGGGDAP